MRLTLDTSAYSHLMSREQRVSDLMLQTRHSPR